MIVFNSYNKAYLIWVLLLLNITLNAQHNLVPNPSFESHTVACANIKVGGGGNKLG